MNPSRRLALLLLALAMLTAGAAAAKPQRFGFQHFGARYTGGYTIATGDTTAHLAGPADIRIRAAKNGRTARVQWANTFYTSQGSYRITLRWSFLSNGAVVANSLDPRATDPSGSGAFTLHRNHPVRFTATAGAARAEGQLRLIGGGALAITVTLTGLPEGDVTYGFSGGRKR